MEAQPQVQPQVQAQVQPQAQACPLTSQTQAEAPAQATAKLPEDKPKALQAKKPRTQKQIEWAKQLGQNSNKYKQEKQAKAQELKAQKLGVKDTTSASTSASTDQTEQVTYIIIGLAIFLGGTYLYFNRSQANINTNTDAPKTSASAKSVPINTLTEMK